MHSVAIYRALTHTIPLNIPSTTRNSSSGVKIRSRSPLEQIKERCRQWRSGRETKIIFHVTMAEPNGRSLPVGHILGLMTWQMEKQQIPR